MTRTKFYDVAIASPVIALLLKGIYEAFHSVANALSVAVLGRVSPDLVLGIISSILLLGFLWLQVVLLFIRKMPARKANSVTVKAVALLGSEAVALISFLHPVEVGLWLRIISLCITVLGLLGSCWALWYLGRGFSILPEARILVVRGPYRFMRHPLYVFETLAFFGITLVFQQPLGTLLTLLVIAAQLIRMSFEERVLSAQFPAYAEYAARTPRLIPGLI